MDFTWETQSSNQMGVTTLLNHSDGRYGDETPSYCKMEFHPNEIHLNTPHGAPLYPMDIHDETRSFQTDCQNSMPSSALRHPIGCKSSIKFHETASYRGVSVTGNEIPFIYACNTPGVTTLYPRKTQTRMSPHGIRIQSDSNGVSQSYQESSINGSPFYQTDNPKELDLDTFPGITPLNPGMLQMGMPSYAVTIQSSSNKAHQSHQRCSSNKPPCRETGNTSEIRPNNIPRVTSLGPREAHLRMPPCGVDIWSDLSTEGNQLYKGSNNNGFPFYQTDISRELYPDNIPGKPPLDPMEVQGRNPPNLVSVQSDSDNERLFPMARFTDRIPPYHMVNPRKTPQMQTESETMSYQNSRFQKEVPSCEEDFSDGVLTQRDDARTYKGMEASISKTSAERSTSPARYQAVAAKLTRHNVISAQTCPRCHCVVTTQSQLSYLPSLNLFNNAHARPSVIMVPLKRKVK